MLRYFKTQSLNVESLILFSKAKSDFDSVGSFSFRSRNSLTILILNSAVYFFPNISLFPHVFRSAGGIPRMHLVFRLTPNAVIRLVQNVYKDQYGKFGMLQSNKSLFSKNVDKVRGGYNSHTKSYL